jgi:hypothetical protein
MINGQNGLQSQAFILDLIFNGFLTNASKTHLKDLKVNLKLKLAALWASFMLFYIYVDHFALFMREMIADILKGKVFVFDITQGFIFIALTLATIPILMIYLSFALPAKANRITNISVAAANVPYMLFNLAVEAWLHMYFAAAVEVIPLSLIIWHTWKWPRVEI